MKLLIKKSTKDLRLGTLGFVLYARLEVTPDELALLDRCNLMRESLFAREQEQTSGGFIGAVLDRIESPSASVSEVIQGTEFVCERMDELVALEEQLIERAVMLERYLMTAGNFDDETVVDLAARAKDAV